MINKTRILWGLMVLLTAPLALPAAPATDAQKAELKALSDRLKYQDLKLMLEQENTGGIQQYLVAKEPFIREIIALADESNAYAAAVEFIHFVIEQAQEQFHQRADFFGRTIPVFAGEREQRQALDAFALAELQTDPHGAGTGAMTE